MDAKKVVLTLVVLFLGFWMFTDPSGLADVGKSAGSGAWSVTTDGFRGLIRFLGEL